MPENTNNDAPGADRPTSRSDQEGPGEARDAACPPREIETERAAAERTKAGGLRAGLAGRHRALSGPCPGAGAKGPP
jgi:hypothetical protein